MEKELIKITTVQLRDLANWLYEQERTGNQSPTIEITQDIGLITIRDIFFNPYAVDPITFWWLRPGSGGST